MQLLFTGVIAFKFVFWYCCHALDSRLEVGMGIKTAKFEVLAVPPLFLQESSHSGGILVEWNLAGRCSDFVIPVLSHSGGIWSFRNLHWNVPGNGVPQNGQEQNSMYFTLTHGFQVDSIWKRWQSTILYKIHLDSIWNPSGLQESSTCITTKKYQSFWQYLFIAYLHQHIHLIYYIRQLSQVNYSSDLSQQLWKCTLFHSWHPLYFEFWLFSFYFSTFLFILPNSFTKSRGNEGPCLLPGNHRFKKVSGCVPLATSWRLNDVIHSNLL